MTDPRHEWESYVTAERAKVLPHITALGYMLDTEQPHLGGERYLMQAVTTEGGRKLVLLGTSKDDNARVVIKATSDPAGAKELAHERQCRDALSKIGFFSYTTFAVPKERAYVTRGGVVVCVTEFLETQQPFLSRSLSEQFFLALNAFKAQEGAHATTHELRRFIGATFGLRDVADYLRFFERSRTIVTAAYDTPRAKLFTDVAQYLNKQSDIIDQYGGFLTHTDFVPHNFRVVGDTMYLLDLSSIRFGNKYEGWARFINFMTLYHPALEEALVAYVRDNRTEEESEVLFLMRLYRLGELVAYYTSAKTKSDGALFSLNEARIIFWSGVLESLFTGTPLSPTVRENYIETRDRLRSEDEKKRQRDLH